jgi:hypothetical protein
VLGGAAERLAQVKLGGKGPLGAGITGCAMSRDKLDDGARLRNS